MNLSIASRYARALFEISKQKDQLTSVVEDLHQICNLINDSKAFSVFFLHPSVSGQKKQVILKQIFSGKINEITLKFMLFLCEKKRFDLLIDIYDLYDQLYQKSLNIVKMKIVSAQPLALKHRKEITRQLETRFKQSVNAHFDIQPDILGGIRIHKEGVVYDYSFVTQLEKFQKNIIHA